MRYILCHKDIEVLEFSFYEDWNISEINDVYNVLHLPLGIKKPYENKILPTQLNKWWLNRSIPASRVNIDELSKELNVSSTSELLQKSFGLSLTDHYWIKPVNSNIKWKEINFYQNSFSKDVGRVLFDKAQIYAPINYISPDNSSEGNLDKKWVIDSQGKRFLIKGAETGLEPFFEVLATELSKVIGINHVPYKLLIEEETDTKKQYFYSVCENFTSVDAELVTVNSIINSTKPKAQNGWNNLINSCEEMGMKDIENIKKALCNMFLLDCLILNDDRHTRNFGFLRNPDTLEWIGLAPIYDSGSSAYRFINENDICNAYYVSPNYAKAKPFAKTQQEQLNILPIQKYCKDLIFNSLDIQNIVFEVFSCTSLTENFKKGMSNNIHSLIKDFEKSINNNKEIDIADRSR